MKKKNKKEFVEKTNEVIENKSFQIDMKEVPEEKIIEERIVEQKEYLEEISKIVEQPESEEIKPVEVKVKTPPQMTVEQYRHFLRTGRLPKQ